MAIDVLNVYFVKDFCIRAFTTGLQDIEDKMCQCDAIRAWVRV